MMIRMETRGYLRPPVRTFWPGVPVLSHFATKSMHDFLQSSLSMLSIGDMPTYLVYL